METYEMIALGVSGGLILLFLIVLFIKTRKRGQVVFLLSLLLLFSGCTRYIITEKEVPVIEKIYVNNCTTADVRYINQTIYINQSNSTINSAIVLNTTDYVSCPQNASNIFIFKADSNDTYSLALINRLKWCERRIDYNATFYRDQLDECQAKLDNITALLE